MINYLDIWKSLNEELELNEDNYQIARSINSNSLFPLFIASDASKKIRIFYLKTEVKLVNIQELPEFRGLEISYVTTSIARFKTCQFLKITQTIPETNNIFESIISDLCDQVIKIKRLTDLGLVISNVLNDWRFFFENLDSKVLSISEQKGLYSELLFLKDVLLRKFSFTQSLKFWTATDSTNHDFQLRKIAVEVKSTSTKQHQKISISSEKQLDKTGLDHLYLTLFVLNVHDNPDNQTLPILIDEIINILKTDISAVQQFQIKVYKRGFNPHYQFEYSTGYSVHSIKTFEITTDFPGIFPQTVPSGVGDVKYTIATSACEKFEIKTNLLNLL